jgi:hypothetical protein
MLRRLQLPLALALLSSALVVPARGQCVDALCPSISESGQIDYVMVAQAGNDDWFNVWGIPAGATIRGAWMYTETFNGTSPTSIDFAGNNLIPQQIGLATGTLPGGSRDARSYRNDVTALVNGNGFYYYNVSGGLLYSVALLILYEDTSISGTYQIEVHDGLNAGVNYDSAEASWPNATTFSGFTVDGQTTPEVELGLYVSNGQLGFGEKYLFQGGELECCDPATLLAEWDAYDVSSYFAGGETSAVMNASELTDAIAIVASLLRVRTASASSAVSYCTAGTSSSGCQALVTASGTPSASSPSGFALMAANVEGAKDGLFFFGANGRQANPWGNGSSYQCVVPPVKRGGLLTGVGIPGACAGSFTQDLNARWTAKPNQNPGVGALVQAQLWHRDPQNTSNRTTSLSDAVEFLVGP